MAPRMGSARLMSASALPRQRIAQLIESDGPGGAESVVLELCTELRRRGHVVRPVIFGGGEGWLSGKLSGRDFQVYLPVLRSALPIDVGLLSRLCAWIREHEISLLHAHDFTMSVYAALAGYLTGVPHVITLHGGKYFATAWKRKVALKLAAANARATVGVSQSTCDHLATTLSLPIGTIQLVANGVSPSHGDRENARRALGLSDNARLILAVGNLYEVKGHRILVDAAAQLAAVEGLPAWRVAIAGRGDEEGRLRAQIRQHGLGAQVELLGLRDDIGDLLSAADVWVMPSFSEGLPMALLEAMFAQLPIVCSAVGGIPDLLNGGPAGLLVPPHDSHALAGALQHLLSDTRSGAALALRARELAEARYSVAAMADRYEALYQPSR
ncbi:MAG: glycosyltransferase family 4 protein [Gemmatimonas sp.]